MPLPPRPGPTRRSTDTRAAAAVAVLTVIAVLVVGVLLLTLRDPDGPPAPAATSALATPAPIVTVPPTPPPSTASTPPSTLSATEPPAEPTAPPVPVPTPDGGRDVAYVRLDGERRLVTDRVQTDGDRLVANDNPQQRTFGLRGDAVLVAGPGAVAVLGGAPGERSREDVLTLLADQRSAGLLLALTYDEIGQVVRVEEF